MSLRACLAATALLVLVWPAHASAEPARVAGRIVLRPGVIEIQVGRGIPAILAAPDRLDFSQLVALVAAQDGGRALLERAPSGEIELRVPIDQRPGSRLAIIGTTVPAIAMTGRGRLSGQDAVLSINGTSITASGITPGRAGDQNPLIGYQKGSGVRMTRVRIVDQRRGPGAGPAIQIAGRDGAGAELRITSALVSGGIGAVRLDDVQVAELVGVQVERAHGAGLNVGGATHLLLRDVTIDHNTGPGLALSGRAVTASIGGVVRLQGNGGDQLTRHGTRAVDLHGVQIMPNQPVGQQLPLAGSQKSEEAELPLHWIVAAAGALLAGAVALEVLRDR